MLQLSIKKEKEINLLINIIIFTIFENFSKNPIFETIILKIRINIFNSVSIFTLMKRIKKVETIKRKSLSIKNLKQFLLNNYLDDHHVDLKFN